MEFLWASKITLNGQEYKSWPKLSPRLQQLLRSYVSSGATAANLVGELAATLTAASVIDSEDDAKKSLASFCADSGQAFTERVYNE